VDDLPAFIVSRSPTQLVVAGANVEAVAAGVVTIQNAVFLPDLGVPSIVAASAVDLEAFDNSFTSATFGGAPDLAAGPFPLVFWSATTAAAPDQWVQFNTTPGLDLRVTMEWNTAADIDFYWYNSGGGYLTCGGGCSTANPEVSVHSVPAGTAEFLNMYLYEGDDSVIRVTVEEIEIS
jgi:hypothetical protein